MRWWRGSEDWRSLLLLWLRWHFIVSLSAHDAGIVVGGTLRVLHWIGLISGGVFCLATGWLWLWADVPAKVGFVRQLALTAVMLLVTAYSQFRILPAMEVDRALAGGVVEAASLDNAGRVDFERLHRLSERLEGLVLLCGLGVVFVLSRESQWPETGKPVARKIVKP